MGEWASGHVGADPFASPSRERQVGKIGWMRPYRPRHFPDLPLARWRDERVRPNLPTCPFARVLELPYEHSAHCYRTPGHDVHAVGGYRAARRDLAREAAGGPDAGAELPEHHGS